jgi:hypothetical protein
MDTILVSRRSCPECGKEFLIENDVPRRPDSKKPSGSVKPVRAVKRAKSRCSSDIGMLRQLGQRQPDNAFMGSRSADHH